RRYLFYLFQLFKHYYKYKRNSAHPGAFARSGYAATRPNFCHLETWDVRGPQTPSLRTAPLPTGFEPLSCEAPASYTTESRRTGSDTGVLMPLMKRLPQRSALAIRPTGRPVIDRAGRLRHDTLQDTTKFNRMCEAVRRSGHR